MLWRWDLKSSSSNNSRIDWRSSSKKLKGIGKIIHFLVLEKPVPIIIHNWRYDQKLLWTNDFFMTVISRDWALTMASEEAQRWSTIDTGSLLHTEGGNDGTLLLPVCTWIIQPDKNTETMEPHWNFKPSSPTTINKQSPTHRGGSGGIAWTITPGCH